MDNNQRDFYREAYNYGIRSGTTIPLEIEDKRRRYLTVLSPDMHQNWSMVMLFMIAGVQYFEHKDQYEKEKKPGKKASVKRALNQKSKK